MEDELNTEESIVALPILEPKKRKKKAPKTEKSVGELTENDIFLDSVLDSVSRMTISYEAEIRGFKIILAAAALKMGGKLSIGKDILDLATERVGDIKITEDSNFTKITL